MIQISYSIQHHLVIIWAIQITSTYPAAKWYVISRKTGIPKKDLGVIFKKQIIVTAQQIDVIIGSLFKNGFHKWFLNYVGYSWRWWGENKPLLEIQFSMILAYINRKLKSKKQGMTLWFVSSLFTLCWV